MKFLVWRASHELGTFSEEAFRTGIFSGTILATDVYCVDPAQGFKSVAEYKSKMVMPPPVPVPISARPSAPTRAQPAGSAWHAIKILLAVGLVIFVLVAIAMQMDKTEKATAVEVAQRNKENDELAAHHTIRIGMRADQCREAWGDPEHVNTTLTAGHRHEQWVYSSGKYLYMEDGILTTIQK